MLVDLVISSGTRWTDQLYSYRVEGSMKEKVRPGIRVYVPFGRGNRRTLGLIVAVHGTENTELPEEDLKTVETIVDEEPQISDEGIQLAFFLCHRYLSDFTSAFACLLPPGAVGEVKPLLRNYFRLTEKGRQAQIPARNVRQHALLELVKQGVHEQKSLLQQSKASSSTLHRLVESGLLVKSQKRIPRRRDSQIAQDTQHCLNEEQQEAFDHISQSGEGSFLLCGVTGSGKTEIYLQLAEQARRQGKETIILVPEISLTPQTIERFRRRFGEEIAILHSRLSVAERYEEWQKIQNKEVSIVVGARSAIFAPFTNLGLIVLDEEHEQSYISDQNPKYHTNEVAEFRARWHHCPLVLGSATPSIDTLYQVEQGSVTRLNLCHRAHGQSMPELLAVDMREELKSGNRSMFSRSLYQAMKSALDRKEQVILFLNKRGHTSFVFCRDCGYVYRCDACDVAMTYHKHKNRLVCHYCGREKFYQKKCPQCGGEHIREFGAGTEMLEEETRRLFPDAHIFRADADTMGRKGAYEAVYQKMVNREIDILLGTQMIAKGFDFPAVTVVGIMAADLTLNLPDLRASEKTFQLITQVAGRAGRGDQSGRVYVQTYRPDRPAILFSMDHDVDAFYAAEMKERFLNRYPPYTVEMLIRLSGGDRTACLEMGHRIRASLEQWIEKTGEYFRLDGPSPSVIERVNRKYRFQLLLRSRNRRLLLQLGKQVLTEYPSSRTLNIVVTIDPRSSM